MKDAISIRFYVACLLFCFSSSSVFAGFDVARHENSVVRIITQKSSGYSTGSGSILNSEGYISTNQHVVEDGRSYSVVLTNTSNRIRAEVVWTSAELDLAIMKIPPPGRPPVFLAKATVSQGADVFALGYPGVSDSLMGKMSTHVTLTKGVASQLLTGPWGNASRRPKARIVQHTAPINPGNSGGPLFDQCGRVVGVNTSYRTDSRGTYMASQIAELRAVLDRKGIKYQSRGGVCNSAESVDIDKAVRKATKQAQEVAEKAQVQMKAAIDAANQAFKDALENADKQNVEREKASWIWRILLGLGVTVAVVLSLRKPRERIVKIIEHAAAPVSKKIKSISQKLGRTPGLVLVGFDDLGNKVRVEIKGSELGKNQKGVSIGRHIEIVDKPIESPEVSRRHARIRRDGGAGYEVEDLYSSNGTWLNGEQLTPFQRQPFELGASLRLGALELSIHRS